MPLSPFFMLVLFALLGLLLLLIQIDVLNSAFAKLGLPADAGMLVLFGSLAGSLVNIPLFSMRSEAGGAADSLPTWRFGHLPDRLPEHRGRTLIAVNLGGCVIPVGMSLFLLQLHRLPLASVLSGIAGVTLVSYVSSRPVPGLGIAMPVFVAPLASVLLALLLLPDLAAPLAYVSGTLGVLIGADLLRLREISGLGAPFASIGGAGTFDGIFFTGVLAALLA